MSLLLQSLTRFLTKDAVRLLRGRGGEADDDLHVIPRIKIAAQLVGGEPELGFETDVSRVVNLTAALDRAMGERGKYQKGRKVGRKK